MFLELGSTSVQPPSKLTFLLLLLLLLFIDINECETSEKPCGSYNYRKCVNMDGDYTCHCEYGFHFNKEKQTCEGNLKLYGEGNCRKSGIQILRSS